MCTRNSFLRSSVLRISDEKTLQLIQEFEKEECLWNTDLVDYPNKDARIIAYEVIARRLDIPNFKAYHVMIKLKNLRNSYRQKLKKLAADDMYKPTVFWFDYMNSFLKPHLQRARSFTQRTQLLQDTTADANIVDLDSDDQAETADLVMGHFTQSDVSSSNQSPIYRLEVLEPPKKRKLSRDTNNDEQFEINQRYGDVEDSNHSQTSGDPPTGITTTILEIDDTPASATELIKPKVVDHYEAFGTYVASLLRLLPPTKALLLEPKIINMLILARVEELNDNDLSPN